MWYFCQKEKWSYFHSRFAPNSLLSRLMDVIRLTHAWFASTLWIIRESSNKDDERARQREPAVTMDGGDETEFGPTIDRSLWLRWFIGPLGFHAARQWLCARTTPWLLVPSRWLNLQIPPSPLPNLQYLHRRSESLRSVVRFRIFVPRTVVSWRRLHADLLLCKFCLLLVSFSFLSPIWAFGSFEGRLFCWF